MTTTTTTPTSTSQGATSKSKGKLLANLRDDLEKARVLNGVPGMSVAVMHKGEVIFAEGFGLRNDKDVFTADTLVPIGSITKCFTATAIGELVAEKKLDWDETPVNKYLPEFELKNPMHTAQITIADLLSHRTGLSRMDDMPFYTGQMSRSEMVRRLRHADMPAKLGSKALYNNCMYAVAGEVAAKVTGQSYEDVVRSKVIIPLGLDNTGLSVKEMKSRSDNHATPMVAASLEDAQKGLFKAVSSYDDSALLEAAAGDIYSNVLDMVKWGQVVSNLGELNGSQVLSRDSVEETLKAHTIMDSAPRTAEFPKTLNYGFGWDVDSYKGLPVYRHGGNTFYCAAHLAFFPAQDLVVAACVNTSVSPLTGELPHHIADILLNLPSTQDWLFEVSVEKNKGYWALVASNQEVAPDKIPNKPMSHPLQAYIGEYSHPYYGSCTVWLEEPQEGEKGKGGSGEDKNKALVSTLWDCRTLISHLHFDTFVLKHDHPGFHATYVASFHTGSNGKVNSISLEMGKNTIEFKRHKEAREEKEEMEEGKEGKKNEAQGGPQAHKD
ncbi:beta-lactamase/transpeptidase-like protein [Linnemannia elongata]|nr:beta-lactamase/transpeptidase-like protein [Linnemannia elongata]